ncbi:MAG: hypothetical protein ACRDZ8_08330 [Acidimicrobiales bacterium]
MGTVLTEVDPDHLVNSTMVDCRVLEIGPLDRIRCDVFITVFARNEPARSVAASIITDRLSAVARAASGVEDAVVELILTAHSSSLDYATLE